MPWSCSTRGPAAPPSIRGRCPAGRWIDGRDLFPPINAQGIAPESLGLFVVVSCTILRIGQGAFRFGLPWRSHCQRHFRRRCSLPRPLRANGDNGHSRWYGTHRLYYDDSRSACVHLFRHQNDRRFRFVSILAQRTDSGCRAGPRDCLDCSATQRGISAPCFLGGMGSPLADWIAGSPSDDEETTGLIQQNNRLDS